MTAAARDSEGRYTVRDRLTADTIARIEAAAIEYGLIPDPVTQPLNPADEFVELLLTNRERNHR